MARKNKIPFQHSQDLETVEEELSTAIERLEDANGKVSELLQAYEPQESEVGALEGENAGDGPAPARDSAEPSPAQET